MATTYNSAFDALNVRDLVENPSTIREYIEGSLQGAFLEEAVFTNAGPTTSSRIPYYETMPARLADKAEKVAEYAEIPTSELIRGEEKIARAEKLGQGVRISREMIIQNSTELLQSQITALQNEIIAGSANQLTEAIEEANVNTIASAKPWSEQDATPVRDIIGARTLVSSAAYDGHKFGFNADSLIVSQAALDNLLLSDDAQRFYIGNVANENPIYRGTQPARFNGLSIHVSSFIPDGTAYVLQSGVAGFYRDFIPFGTSDLYAENGDNGKGGSNQSFRIDADRSRAIAVKAPKAITKITGIMEV